MRPDCVLRDTSLLALDYLVLPSLNKGIIIIIIIIIIVMLIQSGRSGRTILFSGAACLRYSL